MCFLSQTIESDVMKMLQGWRHDLGAKVPTMQTEVQSLHSQDPCEKLSMVAHICSVSARGEDTEGSLELAGH